ncbi:MAG: class B sortase [Ruminococcus sp.]|nr:class B sortase [Ruminococcus sp.]
MLRSWRAWTLAVLTALLIFCLICRAAGDKDAVRELNEAAVHHEIVTLTTAAKTVTVTSVSAVETTQTAVTAAPTEPEYAMTAAEPYLSEQKAEWLKERVNLLAGTCPDFIGWLFMADTSIDNAVVQGTDNQYYLTHAPDGRELEIGTIFLDCRCDRHFSDAANILYGHNMQSGMFGDLSYFEDADSFESHRYGWLMTPDQLFCIDFFAIAEVSAYDELFDVPCESQAWISRVAENAVQYRDTDISDSDRYIALSTCSSFQDGARTFFTGKLIPIEANYAIK